MRKPTALKLAVVASGVAQKDIAAAVGVHEVTLSRYVNGGFCDPQTRERIARFLGRGVGELWPHDGPSNQTPEQSGTSSEGIAA